MKNIILLLCLFFTIQCHAQNLINQKDPFTGVQTKVAAVPFGSIITSSAIGMQLMFTVKNNQKIILFMWPATAGSFGAFNSINPVECSLLFKLDDNSILKFKSDSTYSKNTNAANSSILLIASTITDEQLKILSEHPISIFRVGVKDDVGPDIEKQLFTDKNRRQVLKAAAYMLEN